MPALTDIWNARIGSLDLPEELRKRLKSKEALAEALEDLEPGDAAFFHACSHTTFSPNVVEGGTKVNTICDLVELDVDIRTLPGETAQDVDEHLRAALGDLYSEIEITRFIDNPTTQELASASETKGKLWSSLSTAVQRAEPGAQIVPGLITGGTDARFYRQKGSQVLGAGLLRPDLDSSEFYSRFHGNNERIDLESLDLATQLWLDVVDSFSES